MNKKVICIGCIIVIIGTLICLYYALRDNTNYTDYLLNSSEFNMEDTGSAWLSEFYAEDTDRTSDVTSGVLSVINDIMSENSYSNYNIYESTIVNEIVNYYVYFDDVYLWYVYKDFQRGYVYAFKSSIDYTSDELDKPSETYEDSPEAALAEFSGLTSSEFKYIDEYFDDTSATQYYIYEYGTITYYVALQNGEYSISYTDDKILSE